MKVCTVQAQSRSGAVAQNINRHCRLIEAAAGRGAEVIVFPELSLTGYEPTMAADLALEPQDARLVSLQEQADRHGTMVIAGAPVCGASGVRIGALILRPGAPVGIYCKGYLHADELPYFVPGSESPVVECGDTRIALAICYELSQPEHSAVALADDAQIYIASVAKFAGDTEAAHQRLAQIAGEYGWPVIMANAVGTADGQRCAGTSAAWSSAGEKVAELSENREGMILLDTATSRAQAIPI